MLLTESLTLKLPSEQDEENLIGAFQQPYKYFIGLVIILQSFKPPYSLAFDGRGSARLCIKVIEAFSYPQYNRYNILNKLVKETSELKFETLRALHESIYDPKESPHNLPLLAAYRFKKSGRIEVIDLETVAKFENFGSLTKKADR